MRFRIPARIGAANRAVTALVLALAGCTPRTGVERLVLGEHVVRAEDIAYGVARQRLDVYHPARPRGGATVVVFLYGGRWKYGSKDDYLLIANTFVRRGWITVIPDYRHYPEVIFPGWVEDGASALRWTVDNIERFGGNPDDIVVVGHSAGGHTAALLALDERYLRDAGVSSGAVRGFVSVAGPVDTIWTAPDVQRLMGPPAGWARTYPATHVDGGEPPLLLMHGNADDVVFPMGAVRLAERIRDRGGCVSVQRYRNLAHIDIAVALAIPLVRAPRVLDDLAAFVRDPAGTACPARPATTP